jgi:hypothetical protein
MIVMYYVFQDEGKDLQPCLQSLYSVCVCEIRVATQNLSGEAFPT